MVLSAAIFFLRAALAMDIRRFDKMADRNQADRIQVLVDGAQSVSSDEGGSGLAKKRELLFTEIPGGHKISLGMEEFVDNLPLLRVNDARQAIDPPNAPRLEVEDVMSLTLQQNRIDPSVGFCTAACGFKRESQSPKTPGADGSSGNSARKPMVIQNRDGTFTARKEASIGNSKDPKATEGLVIPNQVVVPIVLIPRKKR